jgi:hypothetical protein
LLPTFRGRRWAPPPARVAGRAWSQLREVALGVALLALFLPFLALAFARAISPDGGALDEGLPLLPFVPLVLVMVGVLVQERRGARA